VRHHVSRVARERALGKLLRIEVELSQRRNVAVNTERVPEIRAVGQQRARLTDRRHLVALAIDRGAIAGELGASRTGRLKDWKIGGLDAPILLSFNRRHEEERNHAETQRGRRSAFYHMEASRSNLHAAHIV
jgi:hypothetical protein